MERGQIGLTRSQYFQLEYYSALQVLRFCFYDMRLDLLKQLARGYAENRTDQLFGVRHDR